MPIFSTFVRLIKKQYGALLLWSLHCIQTAAVSIIEAKQTGGFSDRPLNVVKLLLFF